MRRGCDGCGHGVGVEFNVVGVASLTHKKYGIFTVILMADRYTDDEDKLSERPPEMLKEFEKLRKKGYSKKNESISKEKRPAGERRCVLL